MERKDRYYIGLTQLVFPEDVDSLTIELNDLRADTFSTVEGAQRFAERLKELYDSPIRRLRSFWNSRTQKPDFEYIQVYELVCGEIPETAYRALFSVFNSLAKYDEIIASAIVPKYADTMMILPGFHVINTLNHFELKMCVDADF